MSFSLKETYTDPKKKRLITAYTQFIKETFAIIFGPNNTYCAEDVIDIERELSKKIYTLEENGDINKTNMKYTSTQIKHRCDFDFYKFITLFGIKIKKGSYKVNVQNPEYIKNASKLMLKEWTTNKWNSFWVFRLLVFASGFHSELNKYFFSFFSFYPKEVEGAYLYIYLIVFNYYHTVLLIILTIYFIIYAYFMLIFHILYSSNMCL